MFERRLKELNPTLPTISYDIADLYAYLDTFHDFSSLVYVRAAWMLAVVGVVGLAIVMRVRGRMGGGWVLLTATARQLMCVTLVACTVWTPPRASTTHSQRSG